MSSQKDSQNSQGFTKEEQAAMKARAKELKAEARANKDKAENDTANLDDGDMWPVAYALKDLTAAGEAKISALVQKAVS